MTPQDVRKRSGRRPRQEQPREVRRLVRSGVPLYYQLATVLREEIVSGRRRLGEKLASETELERTYGVSRMTVREALRSLDEEGLIRREAGRGSFVAGLPAFTGTQQIDGTLNGLIAMGVATAPRLLELREVELPPDEAEALGMAGTRTIMRAERLRYYKDEPYCHIVNNVVSELGRRIGRAHWERGSLLRSIEMKLGVELGDAEERVRATLADASLAHWLDVRVGAPLLRVDYLIRDREGRAVETAIIHYRSDTHVFTLHLTRSPERTRKEGWSLRDEESRSAGGVKRGGASQHAGATAFT